MGDKAIARDTMKAAGVPITPGSEGMLPEFRCGVGVGEGDGLSGFDEGGGWRRRQGHACGAE